jgi:hypothetical protein
MIFVKSVSFIIIHKIVLQIKGEYKDVFINTIKNKKYRH